MMKRMLLGRLDIKRYLNRYNTFTTYTLILLIALYVEDNSKRFTLRNINFVVSGKPDEVDIGAISIGYTINRLEDQKVFVIALTAKVCIDQQDCLIDLPIVNDYKVPIPLCNTNFSLILPGMLNCIILSILWKYVCCLSTI